MLVEPYYTNKIYDILYSLSAITGQSLTKIEPLPTGSKVIILSKELPISKLLELCKIIAQDKNVTHCEPNIPFDPGYSTTPSSQIQQPTNKTFNTNLAIAKIAIPPSPNTPIDARYKDQWGFFETVSQPYYGLNISNAWTIANGSGTIVAVIDSGILPHQDIEDVRVLSGYDFISNAISAGDNNGRDNNPKDEGDFRTSTTCPGEPKQRRRSRWHGLKMASIIAATTNNNTGAHGIAGIAPKTEIMPVRAVGKCKGNRRDLIDAIAWTVGATVSGVPPHGKNINVINLSMAALGSCPVEVQTVINMAVGRGITVVAGTGNDKADVANNRFPANCNNVISVAGIRSTARIDSYSNYGTSVDISAPGDFVPVLTNAGRTTPKTGTANDSSEFEYGSSVATAHISGIAALLYDKHPAITVKQVRALITDKKNLYPFHSNSGVCFQNKCGAGIPNAVAILSAPLLSGTGGLGTFDPAVFDVVKNPQLAIAIGLF